MKIIVGIVVFIVFVVVWMFVWPIYHKIESPTMNNEEPTHSSSSGRLLPGDNTGVVMNAIDITIRDHAYSLPNFKVSIGRRVVWKNEDTVAHTVTATDGSWDSEDIASGAEYSHVFDRAGTFQYSCTLHPDMKGQVVVE